MKYIGLRPWIQWGLQFVSSFGASIWTIDRTS
jgi:hypothetical protein